MNSLSEDLRQEPLSHARARDLRLSRFIAEVLGVEFGSLWWVPDLFWVKVVPGFVPRAGNAHPGVCVNIRPPASVHDVVPTLLGVSRPGPVKVVGLGKENPAKPTYFGAVLRPGMFAAGEFVTRRGGGRDGSIRRNSTKPALDDAETGALRGFLRKILELANQE